ncbi:hypothetical protein [Alicyclobacillus tolerans]|uniref:Uncharacterized protein n=1 Tax=Alicyclobacillus tolerans TaxID=90970 RepID=A0A1M6XWQ7_9BACL|nr:hypothetical protein [Alicyclobacillus montanus]SHL10346.1 hypothetical protein SAMN05443507_13813 [Alicyclobacillus montanus]
MGIKFRTINIELDSDNFIKFRKDSFRVSFGHEDDFNEQEYIDLIQKRTKELETENDKLKRILGDKDLEIALLRDMLKK